MVNDGASKLHWLTTQMSWWTCFCWKDRRVIILHQHRLQIACLDSKEISLYVMLQPSLSLRVGLMALERDSLGSRNGARCRKFASQHDPNLIQVFTIQQSLPTKKQWTFEILTSFRTSFWQNSSQKNLSPGMDEGRYLKLRARLRTCPSRSPYRIHFWDILPRLGSPMYIPED